MSSRGQVESREQPFQVVTQKRSSGQARKGFSRDKAPSSSSHRMQPLLHCEEPISANGSLGSGSRKRQAGGSGQQSQQTHTQHYTARDGKQPSSRSGGSVQLRPKDPEREREGGSGHAHRHSWDSETVMQNSVDRIERSQSARFDRQANAETSNRFERLNPDTEAPGDAKSSSSVRGRKRTSRSVSGTTSYRSRSPKRKSGREGKEGKEGRDSKGSQERSRDKETAGAPSSAPTTSCELEWDSTSTPSNSQQQQDNNEFANVNVSPLLPENGLGGGGGELSPLISRSLSDPKAPVVQHILPEHEAVDKMSGASAQGDSVLPQVTTTCSDTAAPGSTSASGDSLKKDTGELAAVSDVGTRLSYSRDKLLSLRTRPLSQKKPVGLKEEYFRGGKWCAEAWLTPTQTADDSDELEDIPSADGPPGKSLPKLKNPSTLSIIREHDPKGYGKVCLSPQRRSFGSGCSWKDGSSSSGSAAGTSKESQAPPTLSANNRDVPFETNGDSRRSTGGRGGFHPHNPPSHSLSSNHPHHHAPRVINHTPLRDQRGWKGGEQEKARNYGGYRGRQMEEPDEPEWMAFGPSDRSEVIELVGFDEHERGRDTTNADRREEGEEEEEAGTAAVVAEAEEGGESEEGSTKTSEGSVGVEEGVVGMVREVLGEEEEGERRKVRDERGRIAKEPENEFMLDGFDFSTSVSICQALESDEEEEGEREREREREEGGRSGPLPAAVNDPHELSSALMKALRVGEEEEARGRPSGRPVNALTLEEVHERENIHTQSPSQLDADQSAFNRLVAVLQSSGAIQDEPNISELPKPPVPLAMPPHKLHVHDHATMTGRVPSRGLEHSGGGGGGSSNSFGYLLEQELGFDEDFSPSPHLHRMPPYHNSLGHGREPPPLTKMDLLREGYGSHRKSLFPTPHPHSHQPPPLPTRQSPSAALPEKWTERSWVYPEAPSMDYSGPQRTLVDALGPQVMHHHPGSGRSASLASRPPPNNWAIEMERRRVMELQQMRERERERDMHERDVRERMLAGGSGGSMGGSSHHHHHHHHPSKPNISLLPTAVMRQLHNTNPSHSLSDIASRVSQSSSSDRLEQDLPGRPVYSHSYSYPEVAGGSGVSHSRVTEYPYPTAHMRVPLRPHHGGGSMGMYPPPPQYIPLPRGMPSQQNPYLH